MSGKKKSGGKTFTIEQLEHALAQADQYADGNSVRARIRATEDKLEEHQRLIRRTLKLIESSRIST